MNELDNTKNIVIDYKKLILTLFIFLIIILLISYLFYYNINKNKTTKILGSITHQKKNYIILTDEESDKDYLLKTDKKYNIGDELLVEINKINNKKDPIEASIVKVKIISKNNEIKDSNNIEEPSKENNITTTSTNNISENTQTENNTNSNQPNQNNQKSNNNVSQPNSSNNNSPGTENDVIAYVNNINTKIDQEKSSKSLSESTKSGFITLVDFLFYDGTIKGKKFKELTNAAKIKVLKAAIIIDSKLDNHFPNYKSNLAAKYQNLKSKALSKYLDTTTEVCANNTETCQSAKEGLGDLKRNFSITWNFIKDISGVGLSKLKSWYEIWKVS